MRCSYYRALDVRVNEKMKGVVHKPTLPLKPPARTESEGSKGGSLWSDQRLKWRILGLATRFSFFYILSGIQVEKKL